MFRKLAVPIALIAAFGLSPAAVEPAITEASAADASALQKGAPLSLSRSRVDLAPCEMERLTVSGSLVSGLLRAEVGYLAVAKSTTFVVLSSVSLSHRMTAPSQALLTLRAVKAPPRSDLRLRLHTRQGTHLVAPTQLSLSTVTGPPPNVHLRHYGKVGTRHTVAKNTPPLHHACAVVRLGTRRLPVYRVSDRAIHIQLPSTRIVADLWVGYGHSENTRNTGRFYVYDKPVFSSITPSSWTPNTQVVIRGRDLFPLHTFVDPRDATLRYFMIEDPRATRDRHLQVWSWLPSTDGTSLRFKVGLRHTVPNNGYSVTGTPAPSRDQSALSGPVSFRDADSATAAIRTPQTVSWRR
jgi:hypothetical protein